MIIVKYAKDIRELQEGQWWDYLGQNFLMMLWQWIGGDRRQKISRHQGFVFKVLPGGNRQG